MALRFLLDEHLRGRRLWQSIVRHNVLGGFSIDVVQVGDPIDLPLGSNDSAIIQWAEREDRILLSRDLRTLPAHLAAHLLTGRHSPGILILNPKASYAAILGYLELAAHAGFPE